MASPRDVGEASKGNQAGPIASQVGTKDGKTPWVSLFANNREFVNEYKLEKMGKISDLIVIGNDEIDALQSCWGYCLVGFIAGRFPGRNAFTTLMNKWGVASKFVIHSSGWVCFNFNTENDKLKVLEAGPYAIYGRPLILKDMPMFFTFDDKFLSMVPCWINLPGLPLECWNRKCLSKIASSVGTPISMDRLTAQRERISYARILVEVDTSGPIVESVDILLPNGVTLSQPVVFETLPKFCTKCKRVGHLSIDCKVAMIAQGPQSRSNTRSRSRPGMRRSRSRTRESSRSRSEIRDARFEKHFKNLSIDVPSSSGTKNDNGSDLIVEGLRNDLAVTSGLNMVVDKEVSCSAIGEGVSFSSLPNVKEDAYALLRMADISEVEPQDCVEDDVEDFIQSKQVESFPQVRDEVVQVASQNCAPKHKETIRSSYVSRGSCTIEVPLEVVNVKGVRSLLAEQLEKRKVIDKVDEGFSSHNSFSVLAMDECSLDGKEVSGVVEPSQGMPESPSKVDSHVASIVVPLDEVMDKGTGINEVDNREKLETSLEGAQTVSRSSHMDTIHLMDRAAFVTRLLELIRDTDRHWVIKYLKKRNQLEVVCHDEELQVEVFIDTVLQLVPKQMRHKFIVFLEKQTRKKAEEEARKAAESSEDSETDSETDDDTGSEAQDSDDTETDTLKDRKELDDADLPSVDQSPTTPSHVVESASGWKMVGRGSRTGRGRRGRGGRDARGGGRYR